MAEEDNKKERNYKLIAVGIEMLSLIEVVKEKFSSEYGFEPTQIDITNLIARRVFESKIF